MRYPLFIAFIFLSDLFSAQVIKFENILGGTGYDLGYSVVQVRDKGYILTGSTTSFGGESSDVYILKTDSMGVIQWQKMIGGINIEQAFSVKETSDTGFVIAGYTNSFGIGGYDIYVIKANKYGDTVWTKTYGGNDWDFGYSIEQAIDGGYIIAGGTYSYGKGNEDMYLIKTNSMGDTLWTKCFGGTNDDEAKSVKQTIDGGFIVTGYTKSFGEINGDFYTVKTNASGDTLWTKKLGLNGVDRANQIIPTTDGGYMLAGVSENIAGGFNEAFIVKTNSTGDTIFTRRYGSPNDAAAYSVCQASDGGYAWVGKLKIGNNYRVYLYKIDPAGNWNFSYTLGVNGDNDGRWIEQTNDGGFVVVGNSTGFNNGLGDIYLFKTDSAGVSSGTIINFATTIQTFSVKTSNSLLVYPNPVTTGSCKLNLSTIGTSKFSGQVNIYSITGQFVLKKILIDNIETEINTSTLENGMYFMEVIAEDIRFTSKICIQNN